MDQAGRKLKMQIERTTDGYVVNTDAGRTLAGPFTSYIVAAHAAEYERRKRNG